MKKLYIINCLALLLPFFLICISSCKKTEEKPQGEKTVEELIIPDNFNFETSQTIELVFQDQVRAGGTARYKVYLYSTQKQTDTLTYNTEENAVVTGETIESTDPINDLVASKVSETGLFNLILSIPSYINQLYVIKNEMGVYSSEIVTINNKTATFKPTNYKLAADDPVDVLYGVNGAKDLFTINPVTGEMVVIDELPMGSYACAMDYINRKLYTVGHSWPYPLYKYDIDDQSFELVANTYQYGPRLDYLHESGELLYSSNNYLYTLDATTGNMISTKFIDGLGSQKDGGDIVEHSDGTRYMTTHGGLYRLIYQNHRNVHADRISANSLPFSPTSTTFDSNDELWLATNSYPSRLLVMDKVTGGWEYRFSAYNRSIHDLTTLPLDQTSVSNIDTDGDGIIDFYDEYPNDANKAYNTYTPSIYGVGAHAFEDNWPEQGDYDFNDLVVNFHFTTVSNADDDVVQIKAKYIIKHLGASFENGFGIELPFSSGLIQNVTGYHHTTGAISVDSKGLETGQSLPVIIVTDDVREDAYKTIDITIDFVSPVPIEDIGAPPFNPFIYIDQVRGREVHLPNYKPTDLAIEDYFGTMDDASVPENDIYYKTSNNLPWVININHDFQVPLETIPINQGYLKFNSWAESGGSLYKDWYKDNDGYKDNQKLKGN